MLRGFLSSRETAEQLGAGGGGSMRADGWGRMPLVRMTNLHLEPGEGSFEELLADVDDGLYLETNKSWSIDDKRLNFQFGTQIAWEIKNGQLGRMLPGRDLYGRDAASSGASSTRSPGRRNGGSSGSRTAARASRGRRARLARRVAGAVPRRRGRRLGVTARSIWPRARSARAAATRRRCRPRRAIGRRALRRVDRPPADADRDAAVRMRVVRDGKVGWASTNRADAGLDELARASRRGRRQAPRRPRLPGLAPAGRLRAVAGYDAETAALGADEPGAARRRGDRRGRRRSGCTATSRAA